MIYTFLESSEKLNSLFPASLQKIKFRIFQNISQFLVQALRPFRHKNMCELCDIISEKDKKGRIMMKNIFVIREEVIYVFQGEKYSHNGNSSFHISHVRIIASMECGKTRNYFSAIMHKKQFKVKK